MKITSNISRNIRGLEKLLDSVLADLGSLKTAVDTHKTLADELKADFNLLRVNMINCALNACGLAEGTNAQTIQIAAAVHFAINGVIYDKAITDNITMTACAEQAISTYCMYLVTLNASGTLKITKGTELATDTAVLPSRPANEAVIGAFKIATNGSTTFTSGTTDLGAAGITDTYYDLMFANTGADASTAIAAADPTAVGTLSTTT